jgi:small subunit ribosomal protein S2e
LPHLPRTATSASGTFAAGDHNGHVGLGVKCAKEVATAIRGAIINAKMTIIPVRL